MQIELLSSPGKNYLNVITDAIKTAQSVAIITAFASPSGLRPFIEALTLFFEQPEAQASMIVGKDRQGFNTASVFETLLKLKQRIGSRFLLEIVEEGAGLMHASARKL